VISWLHPEYTIWIMISIAASPCSSHALLMGTVLMPFCFSIKHKYICHVDSAS